MADVLVLGSTGLIGRTFLRQIANHPSYPHVIALARRRIERPPDAANIEVRVIDFDRLHEHTHDLSAAAVFCALGTTLKKAGSQETFRQVDHHLPLKIAKAALANGCRKFVLISAVGADPHARIFYNRVKGELERDIRRLSFQSLHILRPSLLMGERAEFRLGEILAKMFLQPVGPVLPARYRPISAQEIAEKVVAILGDKETGFHIHEGADLRV